MKTHTVGGKIRDRFSLTPLVMKYGVVVKLENVNYFSGKQRLRSTFVDIPTATENEVMDKASFMQFVIKSTRVENAAHFKAYNEHQKKLKSEPVNV